MADSIKLFQFFQKNQQFFGIFPSQSNQKYLSINSTRVVYLIVCVQCVFMHIAYIVYGADSMFELGFSYSATFCAFNGTFTYCLFISESENTLEFIETCEGFIAKSE